MSDRDKGGKTRVKAKTTSLPTGLQFPVGPMHLLLRKGNSAGAPVYLATIPECLAAEVLELAGNAGRDNMKIRIIPRYLQLAIKQRRRV
ncbi:core histone H2A/H2B/H3/H4 [Opisthorchis viverrini]|uniref:Core histone H2A/H2B/H3/H4 n=1 Tax=Opisthorchis viverrini TaxID=6198 RepID=A0A1S8WI49_OPIVI|nr:core histone H2A/H2B/H3/H4 [Opisthorchis viverrini]